jgi:hypothetical protein
MPIINPDNKELQHFLRGKVATMQAKEAEDANMRELLKPYIVPEDDAPADLDIEAPEPLPVIGNSADVAWQLKQINMLLVEASEFKMQAQEASEFYQKKIEALETRADMLKENCGRFLKMNNMSKLATHAGTIFFSKRTKVTLPADEVLIEFAHLEDPDNANGFIVEKPDKTQLKKYIASSGHQPEGYMEEPVEGISIRKVA